MTGLLGGGHAIYYDAATGDGAEPRLLLRRAGARRRAARAGARAPRGAVRRGARPLRGRPRVVRGARRAGRARRAVEGARPARRGARLVEPALRLARDGVAMPEAHVACLAMLEPVMTMREGARIYAPGGTAAARPASVLEQPGPRGARSSRSRTEGAAGAYTGDDRRRRCSSSRDERGGLLTADDLAAYEARWSEPVETTWLRPARCSRAAASPACRTRSRGCRVCAGCLRPSASSRSSTRSTASAGPETHTTNLVTVDARRQRVRADDEPRPRLRRLAAGPRPASEQHARRGRPAPRPARAGRADGRA